MNFKMSSGFYPQDLSDKESMVATMLSSLSRLFIRMKRKATGDAERFVALVVGHSESISKLTMQQVSDRLQVLRFRMRKSGLNEQCVSEVFAIVRECSSRYLGMRHYPYQIEGAWAMLHGYIIEMETGQGKSLCATLTACTSALLGVPVHVITVNEYLACRDAEKFEPLYRALGLSVASVTEDMSEADKQTAYQSDVVYCTNKQIAFDYLRDRIALRNETGSRRLQLESLFATEARTNKLMLRGLHFAIVDEADSVLIDEAITPLVISATKPQSDKQPIYEKALWLSHELESDVDFVLNESRRSVELTEQGRVRLERLGQQLGGLWKQPCPKEELVVQALRARHLYIRDRHYLVDDEKIMIVDEFTGRVMADRSWSEGLHQMIEIKEGCPLSDARVTLAKISYQRFFRRYVNLSGLTGTAREVKAELKSVYGRDVYSVARSDVCKRKIMPTRVFSSQDEKWEAIVTRTDMLWRYNIPVLIGTQSVQASSLLSQKLQLRQIPHQLLNARQDKHEAEIVAQAGVLGQITVATNMAGRGTDISLSAEALAVGGLYVINSDRHETRRVDRQLYGRCARQSDPGTVESMISLEDELLVRSCPRVLLALCRICVSSRKIWLSRFPVSVFWICQLLAERKQSRTRKQLMKIDEQQEKMMAFSGLME